MKRDGGGNWNRAARKSGGERSTVPAFTPRNVSWVEWSNAVADLVKTATGKALYDVMSKEQLLAWFDAGERPSWAANVVAQYIRTQS